MTPRLPFIIWLVEGSNFLCHRSEYKKMALKSCTSHLAFISLASDHCA
jgi:hypothetical protein